MSPFVKFYLFAYNSLQACAWTISLLKILSSVVSSKTIDGAYASAGDLISVIQTVAVAEVLHGAIGIVPSGALSPLMQWSGRTHFILAVVRQVKEVQDLPWLPITLVAWCLGEMIRYPHYAFNCFGRCPFWLIYLRYTAFIVNFPLGLVGEVWIMYQALPYIKDRNPYSNFFSNFPFTYYDFLRVGLMIYPFLWLKLYLHMVRQRKAKLGRSDHDKHEGKRKRM
ncbi:PREDICTED: very-long-chain (3R)-3-hydroxyacyl-CoA dehydratase 2 isoform X2 [Tarenaya hassleriana]|uniref:very-long-chain (3R)-3-hydroxyacyl-CoA dehydratase 2 isoform X2 n=1 Tax=Tarenaya hassleriana TaxID=28532 RepID=UPI00053C6FFE|nr:PREDICTED: very-long-chain (3R)-3-hydroxyacyl-CoA dehydratase 2 isoform X2 [Tarenaya hassleriana]